MTGKGLSSRKAMYVLMCVLVAVWGLDYIAAKFALVTLDPLNLLFYKAVAAFLFVLVIKLKFDKGPLFRRKDIWLFAVSVLFGDVLYFFSEYTAMSYMPVSLVSIVLGFVPIVSIMIERILYKRRTSPKIIVGIFICIVGMSLIIGVDWSILFQGRIFGYLLALSCVFCWNIFNFMTASLHERYTTIKLTLNQLICVCIMLFPYALFNSPPVSEFTLDLLWEILYLGIFSNGLGFLILVRALHILGPTTTVLFSNFLPVAATFFGWLFLNEIIAPIQFAGGAIVILAGYFVIKERDRNASAV